MSKRIVDKNITIQDAASERAARIFSILDVDANGELTEDEFLRGCLEDDELVGLLNAGGCDPQEDCD